MALRLDQIDQGIDALLHNAAELIKEADILLSAAAFPRAFSLAHLAREELSKAAMLQAAGTRLLAQHDVNWKKLMARLRDHKAKISLENVENLMLIHGIQKDGTAEALDLAAANPLTEYRNNDKNNSLYVGFQDGIFIPPSSVISEHKAQRTVRLAELRLQQSIYIRKSLPKYSERKIGELAHLPNLDKLSIEELMTTAGGISKLL